MVGRLLTVALLFTAAASPAAAKPTISDQMTDQLIRAAYNLGYMSRFARDCPFAADFQVYLAAHDKKVTDRLSGLADADEMRLKHDTAFENGAKLADENLSVPEAHVNCPAVEQSFRRMLSDG